MFCRNCGAENKDGVAFCGKCGAKLAVSLNASEHKGVVVHPSASTSDFGITTTPVATSTPTMLSFKKMPKVFVAGLIACVVVIIAVIGFVVYNNSFINLDKYVEVSYDGYNGFGHASVSFDWEKFEKQNKNKVKFTKEARKELGEDIKYIKPIDKLTLVLSEPSLDQTSLLSDGDEVTYSWNLDVEELEDTYDIKFKYKDKTCKVSGLKEAETFDAFANLEVSFEGVAPYAYPVFNYNGEELSADAFYIEGDTENIQNGESVTVCINSDYVEYYLLDSYGKIPAESKKEYTVSGIGTYVTKADQISEKALNSLRTEVENNTISKITSSWDAKLDEVGYEGYYVGTFDEGESYYHNVVGLVYKMSAHVEATSTNEETRATFYTYIQFPDVVIYDDGRCEADFEQYMKPDDSFTITAKATGRGIFSWDRDYYFYGYTSKDDLVRGVSGDCNVDWNLVGAESVSLEAANSAEYLCDYSSSRKMTQSDIDAYKNTDYTSYNFPGDRNIIQMIINEMYAKHGYQFQDAELTNYFNQKEWYSSISEKETDMDAIYQSMSDIEQANVTLLKENQ